MTEPVEGAEDGTLEVLVCPYCGLKVTSHMTPLVWRGNQQVGTQTLSHPEPACFGFKRVKKKPDAFLRRARQATQQQTGDPKP